MRPNGSSPRDIAAIPEQESSKVIAKMSRYLGRVSKNGDMQSVHRFRTNSRRVEALVDELVPDNSNKRKLLKQLSKLRKKAGKVRDLDVQLAFLKELKMPDRQNHRTELMERLREEQESRSKKLTRSLSSKRVKKIRERLHRARAEMHFAGTDPLEIALQGLPKPPSTGLTERSLHACRIAAKRARYLAELAGESREAQAFIQRLKRAQDEIGQWHDVLKLKERAEELFGGVHNSPLVAALQNISRSRFKRATSTLLSALAEIDESRRNGSVPKLVKPEEASSPVTAAA